MALAVQNERLAQIVGAATLFLLGVGVALAMLLDGCHLSGGAEVTVYFHHTGSLREGADVQIAGTVIGEVRTIRLIARDGISDPDHPLHGTGGVAVIARLDPDYLDWTAINNVVFVNSKGLIGAGFLEFGAPEDGEAPGRHMRDGDQVRGVDPPQMDRVMLRSYQNLLASKAFIDDVAPEARKLVAELNKLSDTLDIVEPHPGAYAELFDGWSQLADRVASVRAKWEAGNIRLEDIQRVADRADRTLANSEQSLASIREQLDLLNADVDQLKKRIPEDMPRRFAVALAKARFSMTKLEHIMATLREMNEMIARGEGNIGGLTNDPEFSDYAKKIGKVLKRAPWKIFGTDRNLPREPSLTPPP